jgi:signal transduction histidine kinase
LFFSILGVTAAALLLFAIPLAVQIQRTYRDEALLRLQRDAVAATRGIDVSNSSDPVELPRSGDVVAVYDKSGRRIAGSGPARAEPYVQRSLARGSPTVSPGSGDLAVAVPLLSGERIVGAVRSERGDAAVRRRTIQAWLVLASTAAVVLALAALAAQLLGRRLTIPLERLGAAARRLGDGDFSAHGPRTGVSEIDAVSAALDSTAARLDDLVSRERSFSADASHQLRTPLAALRIELEAMELKNGHSPPLSAALTQVDRLQSTIDTLLAVARDTPRSDRRSNLSTLISDLVERWHGALAEHGRPLRVRSADRDAIANASSGVVDQILDVLLDNACRHGQGAVEVSVRIRDSLIAVEVSDEGPGFAGDIELAFARRAATSVDHGIGLALARSLAEAEGGRLDVSNSGPGPTITLLIPRAET